MKSSSIAAALLGVLTLSLPACDRTHADEAHDHAEHHPHGQIIATRPLLEDITLTQQYVCQIHSQRHIDVCALETGYLEEIPVREGQAVRKGDVLFRVQPTLYQARLDAELAEARLAELEFNNAQRLLEQRVVSAQEVALKQAGLDKARAKAQLAQAELDFATVRAPFDGIVDRLEEQQGSLVNEGDILTTLSDNSTMWVYFNVPEARYLDYEAHNSDPHNRSQMTLKESTIELVLANRRKFDQPGGDTVTVEGQFNNETGNIAFRADFPNPDGLLRHGQTGSVLIHQLHHHAVVIPQRATFEVLDKRYVYVIGDDGVVRQREIAVEHEKEDIFILKSGLGADDKFVLDGVRQVHDGETVEYELVPPEEALAHQKFHAE